jgi:hypothetical protein
VTTKAPTPESPLTTLPAWRALAAHVEQLRGMHLRSLFADDPSRGERLSAEAAGLYLDYSKNRITDETVRLLVGLAEACAPRGASIVLDGDNVVPSLAIGGGPGDATRWPHADDARHRRSRPDVASCRRAAKGDGVCKSDQTRFILSSST